jgi:hypothetical protein
VTFEASLDFIRLKESWKTTPGGFSRSFFTYHYGPYEAHWTLETVECNKVVVRIDGINYFGKGYHIHDSAKDKRIFQDQLEGPDLGKSEMDQFIKNVMKIRYGKTVVEAFELKLK